MKRYFHIRIYMMFAVGFILFPTSCSDILEEKKYDFIQPQDIPNNDDGATQWVMGTYSKLLDDMFRWNIFPTILEFDCDYISGPDWAFKELGAGNFQGLEQVVYIWEKPYSMIHRANYAIENIKKMDVSERYKQNVIGELNFLKAYSYFLLVRAFGEVPIRRESINATGEINIPRSSVKDVYDYIVELLLEAEDLMYKNTETGFTAGRASAGAAAALLAKVYATIASGAMPAGNKLNVKGGIPAVMNDGSKVYTNPIVKTFSKEQVKGYESFDYKEYYTLAKDKAKQIMDGKYGDYDLLNYDELWKKENRNSKEHIWSLQSVSGDPRWGVQFATGYAGLYDASGDIHNGLWYGCRDHWYKLFENKDYRVEKGVLHRWVRNFDRTWNIGSFYPDNEEWRKKAVGYTDDAGNAIAPVAPFNDEIIYRCNKDAAFLAYLTKYDDRDDKGIERSNAFWPFLRFADVLLIYAEAAAEANESPTIDALNALNRVRTRSNATPKNLTGADNIGAMVDFRSAVLEERAMELALEGDRRWDLIRWDIYVEVMNYIGGNDESGVYKSRSDKHKLFPIPASEINTNKSITQNNPGWS